MESQHGGHGVPLTRRGLLRMAVVGAGATYVLVTSSGWQTPTDAATGDGMRPPTETEMREIRDVAERIRRGEGERLPGGSVIIDGWHLTAEHVAALEEFSTHSGDG
jgi:hypothetical protein